MSNNRGMALYLVLGVLFLTIMLAQMFFNIVLSQASLSHHQVSRNQAFYAARLGMVYAIDRLSAGDPAWPGTGTYTHYICQSGGSPCVSPNNYTIESALPLTIQSIRIDVSNWSTASDVSNGTRPINVTVNYTAS